MNWVWLVINLLMIFSPNRSGHLGDLAIELGTYSHLGLVGAIVVLITPFIMVIYLKKYKHYFLIITLLALNVLALVYSGEAFVKFFEPSTNAMWILAVFIPFIWFLGASVNLWHLLKILLTRPINMDR